MANPTQLLGRILNVVTLTEINAQEINANVKRIADKAEQTDGVGSAVSGMTGGVSKASPEIIVKKLDEIITILKGTNKDSTKGGKIDMKNLGNAIGSVSLSLIRFAIVPATAKNKFLSFIQDLFTTFKEADPSQIKKGVDSLKMIAASLGTFAKGLAIIAITTVAALPIQPIILLTIVGYMSLFDKLGKKDKDIRKGVTSFSLMAKGMLYFAGGISMLAITFAAIGGLMGGGGILAGVSGIALSMIAIAGAMALFGLPGIDKGVKTMKNVGKGFLFLAGGIAILAITFAVIGELMGGAGVVKAVGGMVLAVAGIALVFALTGMLSPVIDRGVDAFKGVGVGFLFLAAGVVLMALGFGIAAKVFEVSPAEMAIAIAVSVLGIAGAFYIVGLMKQNIMLGALGMALMGLSLVVVSFGIGAMYKSMEGKTWEDMGKLGVTLVGLGAVFITAGIPVVAGLMMMGALAFASVGGSLWLLAKGITDWVNSPASEFDSETFKDTMTGLRDGFLTLVDDGKEHSALGGLIGSFITSGKLLAGVTAAMGIGLALSSLAKGVGAWAQLDTIHEITGYDANGMPIFGPKTYDVKSAIKNIQMALGKPEDGEGFNILQPFIDLSNTANLGKKASLTSLLIGADLGESPFSRGVSIAGRIGKVLSKIAEGVATWGRLDSIPVITGYDSNGKAQYGKTVDMKTAIKNVQMALGKPEDGEGFNILQPFIDLSNTANLGKNTSLLSLITGNDLSESPFGRGVSIAGRIGKVLSSLAAGIGSWGQITKIPRIIGYDDNGNPKLDFNNATNLQTAIGNILSATAVDGENSIIRIFKEIGEDPIISAQPGGFSLSRILIGTDFQQSPFEKGVSMVKYIGRILTTFGQGIQTFGNLNKISLITGYDKDGNPQYKDEKVNFRNTVDNIEYALRTITDVFKGYSEDDSENIEDAIDGMEGVGNLLSGLGESMNIFANFENISMIKEYDEKTGRPIYYKRGEYIVNGVDRGFVDVHKVADNIAYALRIVSDALNFSEDKSDSVEEATEGLEGVGDMLTGLAKAFDTFSNLHALKVITGYDENNQPIYGTKEVSVYDVATNIGTALSLVADSMASIGEKDDISDKLEDAGDALTYVTDPIKNFAKIFGSLAEAFPGKPEYILSSGQFLASAIGIIIDTMISKTEGVNKIEITKWKYLPDIIKDFIKLFKSAGEIDKEFGLETTSKNFSIGLDDVLGVVEKYEKSIGNVDEKSFNTVFSSISSYKDVLIRLTDKNIDTKKVGLEFATALDTTLKSIESKKLSDATVTQFGKFTKDLVRLAGIQDTFSKFVSSFDKMASAMGTFSTNFMKMSPTGIASYTEFTTALTNFVKLNPTEFQAKLDLVSKAFGVQEDNKTPPQQITETPAGSKFNSTGIDDDKLKTKAEENKGASQDAIKIIEKLSKLEEAIDRIVSTIDNGVVVTGSVKVTNNENLS